MASMQRKQGVSHCDEQAALSSMQERVSAPAPWSFSMGGKLLPYEASFEMQVSLQLPNFVSVVTGPHYGHHITESICAAGHGPERIFKLTILMPPKRGREARATRKPAKHRKLASIPDPTCEAPDAQVHDTNRLKWFPLEATAVDILLC